MLTLRGRQCLAEADLVLYDGLANPLLLRHSPAQAERTSRVDGPDGRRLDQEAINQRLVDAAQQGLTVVRLKGGDPFIFGRGAEEARALAEADIPFEIVPGITAATAAGDYTGISLTHREHASAVAFVTGHEDPTKPDSALDYGALARFPGTLVFYMGLDRLPRIARSLIDAGMPQTKSAAVVSRASTPHQRTVVGTLAELPKQVESAALRPPSLIIVGECVSLRESINWFESRPLLGQRVGITRPGGQADAAVELALQLGAEPVLMPTIRIEPPTDWAAVDETLERLEEFDWLVFTSVNGVRSLLGRLWETGGDGRRLAGLKLAAIGSATAAALEEFHLRADVVPEEFRAESLAASLVPHVDGKRVLWARASRGRDVLPTELRAAGATVEELVTYRNEDAEALPDAAVKLLDAGQIDWIGLSSPSIARQFGNLLSDPARPHLGTRTKVAAISPVTEEAAREAGLPVNVVAETFTWEGMFAAIQRGENSE